MITITLYFVEMHLSIAFSLVVVRNEVAITQRVAIAVAKATVNEKSRTISTFNAN